MPVFVILLAALGDFAFVLGRMAIVFYAIRQGASTANVLLLGGAEGLVYTVTAARLAGPLVARFGSRRLIRTTAFALGLLFLAAPFIASPIALIGLFALMGFPLALFWPSVHARLVERTAPALVPRAQAYFNLSWTIAMLFAFATAGWLFEFGYRLGAGPWVAVGLAAAGAGLVVLTPLPEGRLHAPATDSPGDHLSTAGSGIALSPEGRRIFAMAGWVALFGAFAVQDSVRLVFPSLGPELGFSEARIGILMAVVTLAQAITFAVTTLWKGWVYQRRWLYAAAVLQAGALILFTTSEREAPFAVGFAMVGVAIAITYAASLFYGLGATDTAGHSGGQHEAMIGLARVLGPILGASAAVITDSGRAPFVMYLVIAIVLIAAHILLFSKLSAADRAAIRGRGPGRQSA